MSHAHAICGPPPPPSNNNQGATAVRARKLSHGRIFPPFCMRGKDRGGCVAFVGLVALLVRAGGGGKLVQDAFV